MNKVLLAGEVVTLNDTTIGISTINVTPNETYHNEYVVWFDDGMPDVSLGSRISVIGKFARDLDNDRALRICANPDAVKEYTGKVDMNLARVSGVMAQELNHWESNPSEGKKAFGDLLLIVDEDIYVRGAVLRAPAIMKLDRSGKFLSGAEIQMEGRINRREFDRGNGMESRLEIILEAGKTKVLKEAPKDPFESFEEDLEQAI